MKILELLTPKRIIGNLGERAAVSYLRKNRYKIIKKNYTAVGAEIDIIAEKDGVTAFIEVKTRNVKYLGYKEARPASSVTPEKQRKIIKAASYYQSHNNIKTRLRFDIIEVYTEGEGRAVKIKEIKHLIGSFDKNSAFNSGFYYQQKKEGSVL